MWKFNFFRICFMCFSSFKAFGVTKFWPFVSVTKTSRDSDHRHEINRLILRPDLRMIRLVSTNLSISLARSSRIIKPLILLESAKLGLGSFHFHLGIKGIREQKLRKTAIKLKKKISALNCDLIRRNFGFCGDEDGVWKRIPPIPP